MSPDRLLPLAWLLPWSWPVSLPVYRAQVLPVFVHWLPFWSPLILLKHSQSDLYTKSRKVLFANILPRLCSISPSKWISMCIRRKSDVVWPTRPFSVWPFLFLTSHFTIINLSHPVSFSSLAVSLALNNIKHSLPAPQASSTRDAFPPS